MVYLYLSAELIHGGSLDITTANMYTSTHFLCLELGLDIALAKTSLVQAFPADESLFAFLVEFRPVLFCSFLWSTVWKVSPVGTTFPMFLFHHRCPTSSRHLIPLESISVFRQWNVQLLHLTIWGAPHVLLYHQRRTRWPSMKTSITSVNLNPSFMPAGIVGSWWASRAVVRDLKWWLACPLHWSVFHPRS